MGVLLQGFFRQHPNRAVPAPTDGDASIPWWWDHLAEQASAFRKAGFSAVWLPPVLKTPAGSNPGADGYGPFDDYDIGSKDQEGSVPTRFGTRGALQRCVAMLRANGLDVYVDLVAHQRLGDPGNFVFRYKGADGAPGIGRFPKDPLNFLPNVPRDPNLGGPPKEDVPFGRELAPINAKPPGYVFNGLIDAADWLTRALDIQGYRLDDVKGLSTDFLFPLLNSKSLADKFAVGEFFDGDRALVNGWVFNPSGMRGRASAFDFPLRFTLAAMCANPGRFNMADLDHAGLAGVSPLKAVTFVENHDTDLSEPVIANKILAYAYILTSEGYPCVYYRDYSTDRDCYGLKPLLDNLIWIHERLAFGPTQERWKDFNLFAYERLGAPGLLVALNNDPDGPRTVEVATAFGANVALHDYTGNSPDIATTGAGTAVITVPRNVDGRGYVCYARAGISGDFAVTTRPVTQDFEGAADLDLSPARNHSSVQPGRIWCAAGTAIRATLEMPGLPESAVATVEIRGPDDALLARADARGAAAANRTVTATSAETGFHPLWIGVADEQDGAHAYTLSVTYTASTVLAPAVGAEGDPARVGQWSRKFPLQNVAVHAHVLPNGKVLFWGRRDLPTGTLDDHFCTPQVWDPVTNQTTLTPPPKGADGNSVNLFCSGHSFLPDGRLLVTGGHWLDGQGIRLAATYDWRTNAWTALPEMNNGRWYPTVLTLADGSCVVLSGSFLQAGHANTENNHIPQVWDGMEWRPLVGFPGGGSGAGALELFPCLHVAPDGRVFMSGPAEQSWFLDTKGAGTWTRLAPPGGARAGARRDYAPSVMYDVGRIVYIGGGNDPGAPPDQLPTAAVETIDLTEPVPAWKKSTSMHCARRQHNATLLPDGTVLVTGGTRGPGFNDLDPGQPVHETEIWDPATDEWTLLATASVDRCYHSTSILLPDATVLSAGGGEFKVANDLPNPPANTHRDAQIFRPPYLFRGAQPRITSAPDKVGCGETFTVETPDAGEIGKVTWIRLPSVTHTNNMNQRINFLAFTMAGEALHVTTPARPEICPPGHYMLFVLNRAGVPSTATIIQVTAPVVQTAAAATRQAAATARASAPAEAFMTLGQIDTRIRAQASGTQAAIGLTSKCPYGLGGCWGGAHEALLRLDGVSAVAPVANAAESTADVYLGGDTLPDVDRWAAQIAGTANGSYQFRGVEISVTGLPQPVGSGLALTGPLFGGPLPLRPLGDTPKIQFDRASARPFPATLQEEGAFDRLVALAATPASAAPVRVTGPLVREGAAWVLHVRDFTA